MNLLAIETSTDACSVALAIGDGVKGGIRVDHRVAPREHARLVLPMVDALLAESGLARSALDGVAFGRGPGSFTGVRIAAAVTQGIALGLDIGVVGVSTLATIAQGCVRELDATHVGVALDARLDEIYWGAFHAVDGVVRPCVAERVCPAGSATLADGTARDDPTGDGTVSDGAKDDGANDDGAAGGETGGGAARARPVNRAGAKRPEAHGDVPDWRLAGPGAERYADALRDALGLPVDAPVLAGRHPNALDTLTLARVAIASDGLCDAASAVPVYLRERVALTEAERAALRVADGASEAR